MSEWLEAYGLGHLQVGLCMLIPVVVPGDCVAVLTFHCNSSTACSWHSSVPIVIYLFTPSSIIHISFLINEVDFGCPTHMRLGHAMADHFL